MTTAAAAAAAAVTTTAAAAAASGPCAHSWPAASLEAGRATISLLPEDFLDMKTRVEVVVVVVVVALATLVMLLGHVRGLDGDLKLVNNGYEGVVVSISDHIQQEHCSHVIHGLKAVLRELSSQLWSATDGRASLREVTVTLPRAWRTSPSLTCSLFSPLMYSSWPTEGHIRVTAPHPGFGSRPWTQQSQGCGRQGDFIQVGGDFLRAAGNGSHAHAARLLLAEWAKFRWGVFDERGHAHDPLYPPTFRDPNTHQWAATGCADGAVRGRICDPSQPGCSFTPDLYTNNHLSASLLAFPHLPTVRLFCTDNTHTHVAPTKHNSLCGGRSAWQIIRQTQDFVGGRNAASSSNRNLEPVLMFVQQANPRYVFVIENTATMNLQRRWEYLRKAMRRVVVYDVPAGAQVGVVTFSSVALTVAPLTVVESQESDMRQRVGSSLPRNTSPNPETQKCILCGLQEALRLLNAKGRRGADGGTVIFITTGSGPTTHLDVDRMHHLVNQYHLRMNVVLYPLTERRGAAAAASHALHTLVEATGGSIFTVMDEGVGNDSKVKMMVALMDALLALVQQNAPASAPGAPVLVHNTAYPGGIASMSAGTFALDDSLGPDARFSIYYYDLNHVGNSIQLTAPSGHKIASVNIQEEDGDVNMIFINLEKAERGLWTYSVENCADSHQGLYVQVTAKQNSSAGLQARLWTSAGAQLINSSDPSTPVVVYAEVKAGVAPIINARVVAKIHRLGTNVTGSDYQPIFLHLWDNGVGDPDITQGDGVYSRYLPQLPGSPGRYLLSADVDYNNGLAVVAQGPPTRRRYKKPSLHLPFYHHHYHDTWNSEETCCGHSLPHVHTRRTPPFLRHLTSGVLEVMSPAPYRDLIPPSRVLDLRVEVNDTVHEISLRWTAPGDDWDTDRAHHYEAVVAPSWKKARAFQGDRLTGLPHPLPAGTIHTTSLHFTRYEE
ncbi:Calcium-activated chloride channel regulator 1-like 10, partial [Homarus americanus]